MKFLSFILAFLVLILSTMPSFMEDKCLDSALESGNFHDQDVDDCKCCSPFSICKTCAGFIVKSSYSIIEKKISLPSKKRNIISIPPVSDFPYSIWHPPQLA